jgi:hypothetical protein
MKSFALDRFYTADFFSGLSDPALVALLSPVSNRLAQGGLSLAEIPHEATARRDYCERLALITGDVDHGFSKEFQLELEAISKLAQMDDLEDIQAAAAEHADPEPFLLDVEPTANELAILLWRWNADFIRQLTAGRPPKASTFHAFESNGPVRDFQMPGQDVISAIENGLRGWFNSHKRGDSCIVRFREIGDEVLIVVGHGDLIKIQEVLNGTQVARDLLRPHDYDLLVYRKDTGTLQIYQGRPSTRLMRLYLQVIGREVFGRSDQFVARLLTLAPLMALKGEAITHANFPMIGGIRLTRLRVRNAAGGKSSSFHAANDVFEQASTDPTLDAFLFAPNRVPQAACFSVSIAGLDKDLTVRVALPQKITVSMPQYMHMIHAWLQDRCFFVTPNQDGQVAEIEPMPCAAGM